MKLDYKNKLSVNEILNKKKAHFSNQVSKKNNYLICGDNLSSLLKLLESDIRFDLCYIDPPFATGNVFKTSSTRTATISSSKQDTIAYTDNLKGEDFIEFIRQRAIVIRELLTDEGSFYLHIDYKIGHYVKVILDEVFGVSNFRNDIARIKCNPKNFDRSAFGNVKDLILFYTKSKKPIWNPTSLKLSQKDIESLFKKVDEKGRRYTTVPIHAPGETKSGATSQIWKGMYPPKGRHWRCSPKELDELDEKNLIEWSKTGNPRRIIYADEHKGKKIQDIWEFKDPMYPKYPTQKNLDLLKFIISTSSNKDSYVLDAFCGSGTTLVAAQDEGRNWVGIDASAEAIKTVESRLKDYSFMNQKPFIKIKAK